MCSIEALSYQRFCILLLVLLYNVLPAPAPAYAETSPAKIIYVDDDAAGVNDGSSWENAYIYLQDALVDANDSDKPVEIRVAGGIYTPDKGANQITGYRYATFQLINGVTIKGGYAGLTDPNARDIELYETILSGDLNGDDGPNFENNTENSYHVVESSYKNETAVIDGFTITGGNNSWTLPENSSNINIWILPQGSGMYNEYGSPAIINCIFTGNRSDRSGGGIYNNNSNPILTNCSFSRNYAGANGGGMENNESNPIMTICVFNKNQALNNGGGMNDNYSSPSLTNCIFSMNDAGAGGGGGISNFNYCRPELTNCIFLKNTSVYGGGICNINDSSSTLANCIFSGNSARGKGGGIYIVSGNFEINNCVFTGNSAYEGGGISALNSNTIINNCIFSGNRADLGGGIYKNFGDSILNNCIIWDNFPNQIYGDAIVTYSDIQGGWDGVGNIDEDPLFAEPGYWADAYDPNIVVEPNDPNAVWVDGDYHLKSEYGRWNPNTQTWVVDDVTSPCINAGDPNMPVRDEPFPNGIRINMGAYGGTAEASKSISDIPEVVNVNDSDNGGQVTLKQGQMLAVTLESNPSTGYSWAPVEKQNSILEKFGDSLYFPSEQDDETIGAGGWEILYFSAVSTGQETLQLVYRRSMEPDAETAKTFSIEVTVN